jgi:hypothetical protein
MQKSCSQLSSDSTMGFSYPSLYPDSSLDCGPTLDNNNQASPNRVLGRSRLSSYKRRARSGSGYNNGSYGMPTTHLSFSPTPIQNSFPQALPSPLHYTATTSRTAHLRVKRAHSQIQDDGKDADAEMAAGPKEAAKIRPP